MQSINLLSDWATHAGIDKNNLEENGRLCAFLFNKTLPVSIEAPAYSDDVFIVIELVVIGTGEIKRKRLETAMQLNAYALETRGGTIGWDTVGERLVLAYRANTAHTSAVMLDHMIANLVEVAETIKPALLMEKDAEQMANIEIHLDNMLRKVSF